MQDWIRRLYGLEGGLSDGVGADVGAEAEAGAEAEVGAG